MTELRYVAVQILKQINSIAMIIQNQIEETLSKELSPLHLEVINESGMHSVPPGSETHFKVIAVSENFDRQPLVFRHRIINSLLADQLAGPVHALSLHTLTPEEWERSEGTTVASPLCRGGSKLDSSS